MYVFLIPFLWLTLAQAAEETADFYAITSKRWTAVKQVKVNSKISDVKYITEPKGADILVMELIMYNHKFQLIKDCVFYRVPDKKSAGHIYVHTMRKKQNCQTKILSASSVELTEIYNFGIKLDGDQLILKVDRFEYPYRLWNLNKQSSVQVGILKKSARTTLFEGQTCYQVSDTCEILQDECDQCTAGKLNIIASKCRFDFNKVCTAKGCGLRNEPACIRGYQATGFNQDYCISDSPIAYCKKDFRVFCEDDVLVCK